jgi:hypothetical protein
MAKFTVRKGTRYRATIKLTGLKGLASNEIVADVLRTAGFAEVDVQGSGGTRYAEAIWPKPDATAEIPPEVMKVEEIDGPTPQGLTTMRTKRKPKAMGKSRRKISASPRRKSRA